MFERFTDRARRVVVLAQEEARDLGHNYIGTEHILLGLIREPPGLAAQALSALGVTAAAARERIAGLVSRGSEAPSGHIPFTPRAKKVLELSLREALDLGHSYIGTEHILLGLIAEGEGVASHVLADLGAPGPQVREKVLELARAAGPEAAPAAAPGPRAPLAGPRPREVLDRLDAITGRLDQVISRLDQVTGRLARLDARLAAAERRLDRGEPPETAAQ
jgi:ATP-dependent Clp protease ATP-binding subunit ClpC